METSVYIHIPFCKSKCFYCDFNSYAGKNSEQIDHYIKKLITEIKSSNELKKSRVHTIFIGGGTPSILPPEHIYKILEQIDFGSDIEITIEANPESITQEKINAYRSYGINRISIGLQAVQNELLKKLGRIHTFETFGKAYEMAQKKFSNINVDLMFGLPSQNLEYWEQTLKYIKKIQPAHLSAYSLIIEPNTNFFHKKNELEIPNENNERKMYHLIKKVIYPNYYQYEISNFAQRSRTEKNFECEHNKVYWTLKNYLGFGPGAHSFFDSVRWNNIYDINKYLSLENPRENILPSTKKSLIEEFMFLGLRMNKGINKNSFQKRFSCDIKSIYDKQIKQLIEKKLLTETDSAIKLTELGFDFANLAMSEFILS